VTSAALGIVLLVVATAALVARYVPIPGHRTLYVVIASPYLIAAAPLALLVFAWGHRWIMAVLAACLTVALVAPQLPWYVADRPSPDAVAVRVMTINMLFGSADRPSIVSVADEQADVLMVQEFTPEAAKGLSAAGIEKAFPYQALEARPGGKGVGLYSRHPISSIQHIDDYPLGMVIARVHVDGVAHDPTVVSLHLAAPWPQPLQNWQSDIDRLPGTLADLAAKAGGGAVIVGGDFNSTIDMQPFRDLLTNGYDDSARQSGAGRELTYPANETIPSFMGIDHILTRNCTAVSTRTVEVPKTDHRALLATVMVPAN
jgi:endonuclease/exonuclease/phosphatase (EEP) superfamily protein YafD